MELAVETRATPRNFESLRQQVAFRLVAVGIDEVFERLAAQLTHHKPTNTKAIWSNDRLPL